MKKSTTNTKNINTVQLIKGKRRTSYMCSVCLDTIMEYSFFVVDKSALVCSQCQKERELEEAKEQAEARADREHVPIYVMMTAEGLKVASYADMCMSSQSMMCLYVANPIA